ncbi:MAG TPA: hydantoinase/carbamoylase family amidase [Candidatus Dormibacteraeota bacterium]
MTPRISADRLLADLGELARIGGRPDGGVDRVAGSEADLAARRWLAGRLEAAGLDARTDEAGNVFGRVPGSRGPWLLLGSHTDTVPAGGRLDGAYGVIAALEILRSLHEAGHPAAQQIETVSFYDEEGVGAGGGLAGSTHLCASPHVAELRGYLELHIEQGPRLEAEGLELGVVEGIVGIDRWDVVIEGSANHAGTTPYAMRRDAGAAAGRVLHGLRRLVQAADPEMVANVGELELLPGATNVVPGEARFVVEMRGLESASLRRAAAALAEEVAAAAAEAGCAARITPRSSVAPAPMDPRLVACVEAACEESARPWRRLVSGAGHDAGRMSEVVPAAMLFVPSHEGVSHSPREHTEEAFLAQGAWVFCSAAVKALELPSDIAQKSRK